MPKKRKVEIFSAGCPACAEAVDLVQKVACPSCEIEILDMNEPDIAQRARGLGVRSVPAVAVDGRLICCRRGAGIDEAALKAAGIGAPV